MTKICYLIRCLVKVILKLSKPLVVVVNGECKGIGFAIALLADIVFASDKVTTTTTITTITTIITTTITTTTTTITTTTITTTIFIILSQSSFCTRTALYFDNGGNVPECIMGMSKTLSEAVGSRLVCVLSLLYSI